MNQPIIENMLKNLLVLALGVILSSTSNAQCDSISIPNSYTISSDLLLSGTYVIDGTFTVNAGVTVFVTPYETNGCGELKIYADNIVIEGTIDGSFCGFEGGTGGLKGTSVTSQTGDEVSLTTCNNKDNAGQISVSGGLAGLDGNGPGAGVAGSDGSEGAGTKQVCGTSNDDAGLIGGGGGAGGGSGGSYGGASSAGGNGGDGSNTGTTAGLSISTAYPVIPGQGGQGGVPAAVYGTATGRDIQIGSGGAGGGGGGRSHYLGTDAGTGGAGGGMVFLRAENNLDISGTILVPGENGNNGGDGGSGDATADCCSDACNDCGERTFSAGSGSGSGAGGGSGGGVFIESMGQLSITGIIDVSGGDGGTAGSQGLGALCDYDGGVFCSDNSINCDPGQAGGTGGAGGGGRIKIYAAYCDSMNINLTANVDGGSATINGSDGSYEEVCGYANLSETTISLGWNVYPNPVKDELTVEILSGMDFYEGTVDVVNTFGQIVSSQMVVSKKMTVNMSSLPNGLYMVRISTPQGTEMKRVAKQ